jgi:tetratricopeptide (TPR) repeat protein
MKKLVYVWVILVVLLTGGSASAQSDTASWERAISLYTQNQYRESIVEFKKVIAEFPSHSDSWKYAGLAHFQIKEHEAAIESLTKALELKSSEGQSDIEILPALSRSHLALNHFQAAIPALEILTQKHPEIANNHYLLGFAYANLNKLKEASVELKTAVKLDPKDSGAWYYLGVLSLKSNQLDDAITSFRNGNTADPNNLEILNLLAEALVRKGLKEADVIKANTVFDEAVKIATRLKSLKDDGESAELLGRIYLAAKKYTSAEMTLSRALLLTKEPPATLYFNLGFAHAQNKAWSRAAEMLLKADKLNPANVDTLNYLGFVYENLQKYPQAMDAYTKAFEASGRNNAEIKAAMDRIAESLKMPR